MTTKFEQKFEIEKKSAGVAFFLWFILGSFGAHRFYCGLKKSGIVILAINIIGLFATMICVSDSYQATIEIMNNQPIHDSNSSSYLISSMLIPLYIWVLIDAFKITGWIRRYNLKLINELIN